MGRENRRYGYGFRDDGKYNGDTRDHNGMG
jgi:hypothetical protein